MAKYNFLNYFRARRFYVMLAIVLLISGLLTVAVAYYRPRPFSREGLSGSMPPGGRASRASWSSCPTAFFGGDAISGEFQNKTGYFLVPNPIRRSAVYVGKWIAALAASSIILAIFALIIVGNGVYYFGATIPTDFLQSVLFAWVYLVAALSLAFAFSSLFKSSSISILMSVILLLFVFSVIDLVSSSVIGIEPWYSITYGAGIVSSILTVPYPANTSPRLNSDPGSAWTTYTATVPEGLDQTGDRTPW